jgi:hypothetical protein
MLAFLHTAAAHVDNFARIARAFDATVAIRHAVREDLLARALADGQVTEATRQGTQAEVQRLVAKGARVVLCTCSTLGNSAEATPSLSGARVLRVDRPMAERAIALGRPILIVAATSGAMSTAVALLNEAAHGAAMPRHRELLCSAAWALFQSGDHAGYAAAIAHEVAEQARADEVVMLAQASMATAATLVRRPDVEILTSPDLGVRNALTLLPANARPHRQA